MDKIKFLEDNLGNKSLIRLVTFLGAIVGSLMCIAGIIAMFLNNPIATIALTTGGGLITGSGLAKALQKRVEQ